MELPLVLRDKENKIMRGILLRKEKENAAGNMIIRSATEVFLTRESSWVTFTLFSPSAFLPSHTSVTDSYPFVFHKPLALVSSFLSPHSGSALTHPSFAPRSYPSHSSPCHQSSPPFSPLYQGFPSRAPYYHRTVSCLIQGSGLEAPISSGPSCTIPLPKLFIAAKLTFSFPPLCHPQSCFWLFLCYPPWLAGWLPSCPTSISTLSCPWSLPYLPSSREHKILLLLFFLLFFLFIMSLCILPVAQIR